MQQVDPDAAAGARERPSEAPERLRADKYQGGGTQGGNEATWTAAAGSAAGSVISCRGILCRIRDQLPGDPLPDPDAVPGDQLQQLPEILDVQQVDPDAAAGNHL